MFSLLADGSILSEYIDIRFEYSLNSERTSDIFIFTVIYE